MTYCAAPEHAPDAVVVVADRTPLSDSSSASSGTHPGTCSLRPPFNTTLPGDEQVAERVWFASTSGPRLAGLIDRPDGPARGWGVFAHGFTLGKDSPAASRICKQLVAEGVGMLRFDNLGLGDSEGDWGD